MSSESYPRAGEKFLRLVDIMARLRAPGGCPWDREQTFESIKPYLLEETYEVMDAIDARDWRGLAEELGDLMLQAVFFAQMAAEENKFSIEDSLDAIAEKLVRRHPHVFGSRLVRDAEEVLRNWEQIKRGEARAPSSILGGVPRHLPALAYAQVVGRKVARVGFDWPDVQGVLDKLSEEAHELSEAADSEHKRHELGDLLLAIVNLARWLAVDAEDALREANARFVARFQRVEALAAERRQELNKLTPAELDALWEQAKADLSLRSE